MYLCVVLEIQNHVVRHGRLRLYSTIVALYLLGFRPQLNRDVGSLLLIAHTLIAIPDLLGPQKTLLFLASKCLALLRFAVLSKLMSCFTFRPKSPETNKMKGLIAMLTL